MKAKETNINWNNFLIYDETSFSCLRWKIDVESAHGKKQVAAGDEAGCLNESNRHICVGLGGQAFKAHRIIWEMHFGGLCANDKVDHKDGDTTNNKLWNLEKKSQAGNCRNSRKKSTNTSGVVGVGFRQSVLKSGVILTYWSARWMSLNGENCEMKFSINKLGYEEAFRLACEYRAKMIEQLNAQGAGYTDRHGK